ncbi:hypothetical protein DFS34DRAFT_56734 [Phlyctochytrium arcticum]|nr:hypothetical protein DFS34DRAFT_56734 [Phlyctochytrium arcticum]
MTRCLRPKPSSSPLLQGASSDHQHTSLLRLAQTQSEDNTHIWQQRRQPKKTHSITTSHPPRTHHTFRDKFSRATRRNPVSNTQASTCTSTHNLNLHISTQPQPARQDLHPGSRCRAAKHGRLSYGTILILILIQTTSHTQLRHPPQPTSPSPMYLVSGHQSLPCLIVVPV